MAFGQSPGLPATPRQVQELLALLLAAGHDGFRDARGPLGLSQRQAGGKFTRDEAAELIDQLLAAEHAAETGSGTGPDGATGPGVTGTEPARRAAKGQRTGATSARRSAPKASPVGRTPGQPVTAAERRTARQVGQVRDVPSEVLAGELQRRGWAVLEP